MSYKPKLAELRMLIGNPDAYAVQHEDGSWRPVEEPLTDAVLRSHRHGEVTVGTYIVKPPDLARTLVFDIDGHGTKDPAEVEEELRKVEVILGILNLTRRGVEDSGGGGYHVWLVADEYMPAETLYRLGRGVREEAGLPRLEVFPKQTQVRKLGNLVKLPGGVHRVTGQPNDFTGMNVPVPIEVQTLTEAAALYPEVAVRKATDAQSIEYPCVHSIQEGVPEGGRNVHLFHLAVMLRRWSINEENVRAIVERANSLSPDGPLPQEEIDDLVANSQHSGPVCSQLDESVHCQDQCILARHTGLYTRAGSLRWAAEGERVVVEVESRTDDGKVFELSHPDIEQARAIVRDPRRRKNSGD